MLFAAFPYSTVPLAGAGFPETPDYAAMLESSLDELVYTVTLDAWDLDADAIEVFRFGSVSYASDFVHGGFDGRLNAPLAYRKTIVGDRVIGEKYSAGEASIGIGNADGTLDALCSDYAVDGRAVEVRVGRRVDPHHEHLVIFRGVGVDVRGAEDQITLVARANDAFLSNPIQTSVYAGTGGREGDANVAGKRKPICFGEAQGVPGVLIDASINLYQVHDSETFPIDSMDIAQIYDKGATNVLAPVGYEDYDTLAALPMMSGQKTFSYDGYFRVGAPPDGQLFCHECFVSLIPPNPQNTHYPGVGDIAKVFLDRAGIPMDYEWIMADIENQFTNRCNVYVGPDDAMTVGDMLDTLFVATEAFLGFTRKGVGRVREFDGVASSNGAITIDASDVISMAREPMPAGVWPPMWRITIAYGKNYTVVTDFAGSATDAVREFYSQEWRYEVLEDAGAYDTGIREAHPLAQEADPLYAVFDAGAGVSRSFNYARSIKDLYAATSSPSADNKRLYRAILGRRGLLLDVGDDIQFLNYPRFGFGASKLGVVVEVNDRIDLSGDAVDQVEILWFG